MKEIARGAEAVVFEDGNTIVKERLKKGYRHPELDEELRRQRTKKEAGLLKKLKIPHPTLILTDNNERIVMEKINGEKARESLDKNPQLAEKIGRLVAGLHNQEIIHGDLTTSNILMTQDENMVLIDFGLSFQSHKVEDKAVDIHLFKQAVESKHYLVFDVAIKEFLKGYSAVKGYEEIMKRLEAVEHRGRYKK
jgi:Kae1-associated kinase Bud32